MYIYVINGLYFKRISVLCKTWKRNGGIGRRDFNNEKFDWLPTM